MTEPGHSSDSLSFRLPDDDVMLTGDTVLGRSAPAILHPDGRVDQMIASLELIKRLLDSGSPLVLPGHGPLVTEPDPQLTMALAAREARLAQVEGAVRDGCHTVAAIAERLYGKFDRRITYMVEATVRAHLRYLLEHRGLSPAVEFDG